MLKEKDYKDNPLFVTGKDGLKMGIKEGSLKHDDYIYRGKETEKGQESGKKQKR